MEERQILREFELMETGSKFISDNFGELQARYGNRFIAVKSGEVIATAPSFEEIIKKAGGSKLCPGETIIQFMPLKGEIILY